MKFAAAILLACVAVSSAAFTANLVQHTQPAVNKALFTLQIASNNKAIQIPAVQNIVNGIVQNVQNTIQQLVQGAQSAIQQGQQLAQQLTQVLQATVQQVQQLAGQTYEQAQQVGQQVLAQLQTMAQQATGQAQQVVQQLIAQVQAILAKPGKVDIGALITSVISAIQNNSQALLAAAQQLIQALNLQELVSNAVNQIVRPLNAQLADQVLAALNLANKGVIGDLFGNLWNQVTGAAQQIAAQIAAAAQAVQQIGAQAVAEVQAQASQFLQNVSQGVSTLSSQAASQILSHISDLQGALGNQYQQVVDALNNIVINGN